MSEDAASPTTSGSARASVAVLLTGWAAFSFPLLGDVVPYYRDILRTDWPMRVFIGASLRDGRLPQWYPFEGLGLGFIGNAEGLFRPLSLLYLLPYDALHLIKVELSLCVLLGLFGMQLLGKRLGASWPAATAGAFAFVFSGYALSLHDNLPYVYPYHLLPWGVLAAQLVLTHSLRWAWTAALAIVWSQLVLGGDPLAAVFLGGGMVALVAAERAWKRVAPLGVAALLTAGLCLIWALPAYALFGESVRVNWKPDGTTMAFHLTRLPELVLGGVWFDPDQELALKHVLEPGELWAGSLFLGATVVGLAVIGAVRSRSARVWAVTALLFLWAALGAAGGLHTVLRTLFPLLGSFRYPEKYVSFAMLGVAVASTYGFDVVREATWQTLQPVVRAVLAALIVFGVVGVSAPLLMPTVFGFERGAADLSVAWLWGAGATGVFVGLQAVVLRRVTWLSPLLLAVELLVGSHTVRHFIPSSVAAAVPQFCVSAAKAGAGVGQQRVWTGVTTFPKHQSFIDGPSWTTATLNLMEPDACALCSLEDLGTPNLSGSSARWFRALNNLNRGRLALLFNAGVAIVNRDSPEAKQSTQLDEGGAYVVVRPPKPARARAYDAHVTWVPNGDAAYDALMALPDGEVVFEGTSALETGRTAGHVEVTSYEADAVTLSVDVPELRAVVLNDLYAPGWTVTIDDEPTALFRANYVVRGVLVPAGKHRVQFSYETPGLGTGSTVSALTLVACLVLVFVDLRRRTASQAA